MKLEDYSKYYIQGSDHYLIPKDDFIELFDEMNDWKKTTKNLKQQLDYIRSGEYYNQLRFEREMLEYIVKNGEVSKEDKQFIDMTHRNTELLEENQELKKQLEEWEHHLKCSKEMLDIQGQKGNYDYDEYMLGLYNGMEYIIALFETREPNYISGKDVEFPNNKTQQKEFINYLEDEIKTLEKDILETVEDMDIYMKQVKSLIIEEILQKYKEIIEDGK